MGHGASNTRNKQKTNRAQQLPCLKIAIVGDSGVGKSSLLVRFVHNQFSPIYTPTKKIAIENLVKKFNIPDHALVSIMFWDLPGSEEFDHYKSYFSNLDAAIVVVDISDVKSIEMALVWKQLLVNNMTITSVIDNNPGVKRGSEIYRNDPAPEKYTLPILLLGTKLDIIEQRILSSDNQTSTESILANNTRNECLKCVKELEEYGSRYDFTGSVAVSARDGDGSVHQAIQSFIRHVVQKHYPVSKNIENNNHSKMTNIPVVTEKKFDSCGINTIDSEFYKAEKCVHRIELLSTNSEVSLKKFFNKCIKSDLIVKEEGSLETCVIALKKYFCSPDTILEIEEDGHFCTISVKSDKEYFKMAACYEKIFKIFNLEYSASIKAILCDFPDLNTTLSNIDKRITALCEEYQDVQSSSDQGIIQINYKVASSVIERNRAIIRYNQNRIKDQIQSAQQSLKKIKTAFLW